KNGKAFCHPELPRYGIMHSPRPDTPYKLHIFLHECAHFDLHSHSKQEHVEEYEAEQWAFARMREAGIPIPRETMRKSRQNVGNSIIFELWGVFASEPDGGASRIEPRIARFALGRNWRQKVQWIIDARARDDADCLKSFLGW